MAWYDEDPPIATPKVALLPQKAQFATPKVANWWDNDPPNMAAGRVQSPGVVAPTNPPPPSNYPPPAVAQSSMVSPDYAKVDTGFGPKYVEPIARGITNAATTIPFTNIGRLGDKVYGPRQPFQSEGAEMAGEFAGSAIPYNYAAKGMQYIGQGIKGIRGLYTATKLAENATTGQKAAHLGIEASKAAGRGALFGGVGEGLGQAADAAGRAVSGNEGEVEYTAPIKEAGFFAGIDAAMTLLPPALRGAGMAIRKHLKSGNVAAAEQIVNRIPDSEASQKIKGLFENWKMEYSKGSAVPGEGAPEPMVRGLKPRTAVPEKAPVVPETAPVDVPRETPFEGPISISQAMRDAEKLTAIRKERARRGAQEPTIQRPDVKQPVKMIDNAPKSADGGLLTQDQIRAINANHEAKRRAWIDKERESNPSFAPDIESKKELLTPAERQEVERYEDLRYRAVALQGPDKGYKPYKFTTGEKAELKSLDAKYGHIYREPSAPVSPAKQPTVKEPWENVIGTTDNPVYNGLKELFNNDEQRLLGWIRSGGRDIRDLPPEAVQNGRRAGLLVSDNGGVGRLVDPRTGKELVGRGEDISSKIQESQMAGRGKFPNSQEAGIVGQDNPHNEHQPYIVQEASPVRAVEGSTTGLRQELSSNRKASEPPQANTTTPNVEQRPDWQLTKSEYGASRKKSLESYRAGTPRGIGDFAGIAKASEYRRQKEYFRTWRDDHRQAIRVALASGKPVPASVLADYPDLVAQGAKPPVEPPKRPKPLTVSKQGMDAIEQAKQEGRDAINAEYASPKDRADAIEHSRNYIEYVESREMANYSGKNQPFETYRNGDKIGYTGEYNDKGEYTFIYLEGPNKGKRGVTYTPPGGESPFVSENVKAHEEMQAGFRRLRESGLSDQMPNRPKQSESQRVPPPTKPPKPPTEKLAEPPAPEPSGNVSSLSIRTEADAIAKKLTDDFGSLPEYKTMDMREQANRAKGLIDTDVEQAKRIAMGLEAAPEGLRDASVYEAVKFDALKKGDVETLRKLAVESTVPSKLSAYGQEIKASDSKLLDDPVRVMQDVVKTRQDYAKRTGQRYTSEEIERLKTRLADAEKKLSERVKTAVGKAYGAKNRIVSTQAYLAAKARIRESLATAHSGIPPELLAEVSKIGAYHLEAGTRVFADWSTKMIEDLGDKIKPHLNDLWRSIGEDRRIQIALKAQKTRLERETGKYQGKLEGLDFSKPEKRTLVLDPEARRLKVLRDVAKRDWEAALNSYGSVTKEEAGNIVKLSNEMTAKLGELEKGGDRLEYGAARVAYENYVNYLKGEQTPLRTLAKAGIDKFKTTAQTNKAKAVYDLGTDALKVIVNNSVSMVATLDNSFLGRQGLKTLQVHPTVWAKGAVNSFVDMWKTLGGKDAHSALMADVYSRPNYLNGSYEKAGILAKVEEQYPSSLPERIPGVGRVFKASENAFTGSAIRMRTGLYDLLAKKATENGIDMTDAAQIKPLGKLINSLTARGQWGKTGEPAVVRLVMWAPKMLKGNIDVLTAHGGGIGLESSFARKQAAINLLKIVTETATLMTIANALKPGSAETDPRSSDFGKIRIGNTRYDFTGGAASIVTLAARIATGERKSTNTGEMIPYGTKYGQASELDALVDFIANKTNPPAHVVVDWLRGRDYKGEPFGFGEAAFRATTPIIVQQAINLKDDHSANAVAGLILDGLGVNSATYAPKPVKEKKTPDKPKVKVGPISQADIDSIPAHIQVKYQGIKSKSGEKVQMTGSARQVLKDLYAESELYTKILESLT